MRARLLLALVPLAAAVVACPSPARPCDTAADCNPGEICLTTGTERSCQELPPPPPTPVDAGPGDPDAGLPLDGGPGDDAGQPDDAGPDESDAGPAGDAGPPSGRRLRGNVDTAPGAMNTTGATPPRSLRGHILLGTGATTQTGATHTLKR